MIKTGRSLNRYHCRTAGRYIGNCNSCSASASCSEFGEGESAGNQMHWEHETAWNRMGVVRGCFHGYSADLC